MIHIFNRREVFLTTNTKALYEAKDILAANGIPYLVRLNNGGPMTAGRQRQHGSFGIDTEAMNQYRIFVHKKDYEQAVHLLTQARG